MHRFGFDIELLLQKNRSIKVLGGWLFMLAMCMPQRVQAQSPEVVVDPGERERAFESLAREAEEIQKTLRVLKKCSALVKPSVVHIEAEKPSTGGSLRRGVEEAGSGFIVEVNKKMYVITNLHVVKGSALADIHIKLFDSREFTPQSLVEDPATDIAVLGIRATNLVPAHIGNSDKMDISDFVLAVGSPFGLSQSITFGIVSAKGRHSLELSAEVTVQDFIQTDAAINPGNSGGPLVNLNGEIIGMNTAIASQSGGGAGIGFAIPSNIVMKTATQLIEHGAVARGYLGVSLDNNFTPATATRLGLKQLYGARVTEVKANTPAFDAKLQVDDVIIELDDKRVENNNHLISMLALTDVGKTVKLVVLRNQKATPFEIKVTDRNKYETVKK